MNDMGNGSHGPKTHRSLLEIDKLSFSSPQNRRTSLSKYSQKSQNYSIPMFGQSMRTAREATVTIHGDVSMAGPVDRSARGVASSTSLDSVREIDPPILVNVRKSVGRIQEVLGSFSILLVDDSVSILKMTKRAIQNDCENIRSVSLIFVTFLQTSHISLFAYRSHSFMEAKNGEEAFEIVLETATSFELIITDIQMPICDGFQFTRKVRRLFLMYLDALTNKQSHIPADDSLHSIGTAIGAGSGARAQDNYRHLRQ